MSTTSPQSILQSETKIPQRHDAGAAGSINTPAESDVVSKEDDEQISERGTLNQTTPNTDDVNRIDEVEQPVDEAFRKGWIASDRDPDLEESDDDIAQDPTDGTLPRE